MADTLTTEFGGVERAFRLRYGEILDLEDSCGGIGFGELYNTIARHRFKALYLRQTIKFGLVGGGMEPAEAERLVKSRFDSYPVGRLAQLALAILVATYDGIPSTDKDTGSAAVPFDQGRIFASFIERGITPDELRSMRFKDFVLMCRAIAGNTMQAPTEDDFDDILNRLGPGMGYVDPEEAEYRAKQSAEEQARAAQEAAQASGGGGDTPAPENGTSGAP